MEKCIKLAVRVNSEQHMILQAKAKAAGFSQISFYVRSVLFKSISMEEKINAIYEKVCKV